MSKGNKKDQDKPMLAFIPTEALIEEGKAFSFGAKKYASWNYKNGLGLSRTTSAALRHIFQFLAGEDVDPESGAHHLGCARANLGMALDTLRNHPELDDRYKGKDVGEVVWDSDEAGESITSSTLKRPGKVFIK